MKKLCFAIAIAVIAVCGAYLFQHNAHAIINWIQTLGLIAPVFFLFLYCIATLLFLPTIILTLAGGALFGPIAGTFINLFGATIGACCAFCMTRYFAFDWLAGKKNIHIHKLMAGVERRGWQFVALMRLLPIIPFNVVNYGLGLTRIKLSHFLITTAISLIPTEIFFTYCGYAGMDILTQPRTLYSGTRSILLCSLGILLFVYILLKRNRRHLNTMVVETATKSNVSHQWPKGVVATLPIGDE